MKLKLYIDFDGVILNTIETIEKMIREQGLDYRNFSDPDTEKFLLSLDWEKVIQNSVPLANSIQNIQKLRNCGLYEVAILTHVNSFLEGEHKKKYLSQFFTDLVVIPVFIPTPKYQMVDCYNAILVDDTMKNLTLWKEHGGIPIQFSTNGKRGGGISIHRLDMLIEQYEEIKKQIN